MDLPKSRNTDLLEVSHAAPNARNQDVVNERQELARLIGRLLAQHWLKKQRTGRQGQAAE